MINGKQGLYLEFEKHKKKDRNRKTSYGIWLKDQDCINSFMNNFLSRNKLIFDFKDLKWRKEKT